MKNYFLGLMAMALAVGTSGFTTGSTPSVKTTENPRWFYTESTTADQADESKYVQLTNQDTECDNASGVRCVIEAPANGSGIHPSLAAPASVIQVSFKN